jgi:rfaE bifunctional protein nucleotidyltransferase chain/domain
MGKLILSYELGKIRKKLSKRIIGLCHGGFDILHNGHLEHFEEAKKNVDILIVSVTADKFVIKGPNQPYNNEVNRAKFLLHIKYIDYVVIDHCLTAEKILDKLKPDFYIKGKDYKNKDITNNLNKEIKILKNNKGKLLITETNLLSSTKIINKIHNNLSLDLDDFLKKLNNLNAFDEIYKATEKMKMMNINIIGEPIIDKYISCEISGITTKDPAISSVIENTKSIPGGTIAITKMISKFVNKVKFFTYGNHTEMKNFFKKYKNIKVVNFDKSQKIQSKTRFINSNRYEKLLQVTNFKKNYFAKDKIINIINLIKKINDNVIICDFGIGLFENKILASLENNKSKKYLNVQSNSINLGYNLFTKYKNYNYLSLDEREWKLGLGNTEEINLLNFIKKSKNNKNLGYSITKGKKGSEFFLNNQKFKSPVFISKTVDTTGCGDAYFALTSLMIKAGLKPALIPFVGNIYAGMHGQYFGNEVITDKITFLKYVRSILKR